MVTGRGSKNNVMAGLFLLISLALAVGVILVLSDAWEWLRPQNRYFVQFALTDGAEGLDVGAPVKVGGKKVGSVSGLEFVRDPPETGRVIGVKVGIKIHREVTLYRDATALLVVPLLGSNSAINIVEVGNTSVVLASPSGAVLEPKGTLYGHLAPPSFLAQAGYGPAQATQVQVTIESISRASERIDRIAAKAENELDPVLDQVRAMLADAQQVTGSARAAWESRWRQAISDTVVQVSDASRKLVALLEQANAAVATAQGVLDENRPTIRDALANVRALTEKLNGESYDQIRTVLEKASDAMTQFSQTAARANTLLHDQAPELGTILTNARLASEELKLAMSEVRAAPWRALYSPTHKELENERLYASVRVYSAAVGDLRAAAASLEAVSSEPQPTEASRQTARDLAEQLTKAFDRYRNAEEDFLKKWIEAAK